LRPDSYRDYAFAWNKKARTNRLNAEQIVESLPQLFSKVSFIPGFSMVKEKGMRFGNYKKIQ